ncbi:MAG: chemotaxis protein CheW [Coriobacteriia bacterium]|nr:chemotaxis protein CheW [Actinomycetota bacterium]MDZ4167359.1 chemotaxis protein CheW [Coriobacteriia bacterium]
MTEAGPAHRFHADEDRAILRRRAESLAQAGEEAIAIETVGLLLFRLGEEWYAVPIERVREIYNEYAVTRVPRVPDFVLGVVNVRGEIVSVTDIATLMRVPSRTVIDLGDEKPPAIIVANDTCSSAIVVDEIGDIVDVPKGSVEPPLSTLDKSQVEYIAGSVFIEGRLIGIVNLEKALEPVGENT